VEIEFDPAKEAANKRKHGISLARAADMDFGTALIVPDTRRDYGERRWQATGWIEDRVFLLAFTMRGLVLRAISLRRADRKEAREYVERT
jgi:uncharacterized DUF497 family protein